MLCLLQSYSPHRDAWHWCFGFARKAFLFPIFLIINVHPCNETNLETHYNLHYFQYGHYNHFLHVGIHDIDALGFARKAFLSTIYLIINVNLWNESNIDTHYNLHSFCYRHYNHVFRIRIHEINALDLQQKLFFLAFSL